MSLPHFEIKTPEYLVKSDVVYSNLVEVDFNCYPILNDLIVSISDNKIKFNLNVLEDGRVEPLQTIYKLMDDEEPIEKVTISFYNKENKIHYTIKITDLEFKKIIDLMDFDYNDDGIKFVEVEFDYVGQPKIEFSK
jgi:hypothetical protein